MELKYYVLQQGGDGSIFCKFLNGARFVFVYTIAVISDITSFHYDF